MKLVIVALAPLLLAVATNAQFTDWSAPVNLGPMVNSEYLESCTAISKDGRSLFLFSTRYDQGKSGIWHLYVAKRSSADVPWEAAQEVTGFNDGYTASCPALSPDEYRLYFASSRPGGCGSSDLWVATRRDRKDDFTWEPAANPGCESEGGVNDANGLSVPTVFEDETGTEVLYFTSNRPGGAGGADVWESRMKDDGTFGPATPVLELGSANTDYVAVRRDGLEVIVISDRPGGPGGLDLWTVKRESTEDRWLTPVLIPLVNSPVTDGGRAGFSFNGRAFYFTSDRPGGIGGRDIYVMTRERLRTQ